MVKGIGPSNTNIMIVADYATKEELQGEYALESGAGRRVDRLLKNQPSELQTSLQDCYRTCFYKDFLKGAEVKDKRKAKKILQDALNHTEYKELLLEEITNINPNVIISLGELALNVLTKETGIHKYRGSILSPHPLLKLPAKIKIIPAYHPRDIIKQPEIEVYTKLDYTKALKYKNNFEPIKEDYLIWICRSLSGLQDFYQRHKSKGIKFGTTDLEAFLGYITYASFCFDGYEAISVPLWDSKASNLERAMIWQYIQKILNEVPWINQNIKYDSWAYERWGFEVPNIIGDTMLAGHTLYPELPKNLGFYTSIYTELPYHKDEGKDFNPTVAPEKLGLYNAKDALVTWRIHEEMVKDLKETKLYVFYKDFVMPLFHFYRKVDKRGILVDESILQEKISKYELLYLQNQEFLNNIAGKELNVNSPLQVGQFVYEDLQCPKHTHVTPGGDEVYSTGKDVIEEVYINELGGDETRVTILKNLLVTRRLRKLVQFLKDLKIHPDGHLRSTVRLEGTESGRTSGSSSYDTYLKVELKKVRTQEKEVITFENYGYPFQTIPKHGFRVENDIYGDDIHDIFKPSPGYTFVEGDLGQAEARVVCVLSDDFATLDIMNRTEFKRNLQGIKDDLHTLTAMLTMEQPFEVITNLDRQDFGKKPRHAGNYDQTAFGLAVLIHKSVEKCQEILNRFHAGVPNVRQVYHRTIRDILNDSGYLITPQGRRKDYFKRRSDKLYRVAYSYIPQAVVSDHMKWTGKLLEDKYNESEAKVLAERHDSLLWEVLEDIVEPFKESFKEVAERPISFGTGSIVRDYDLVIPLEV